MTLAQPAIAGHQILLVFDNWAQAAHGATVTATSTATGSGEPFIDSTPDKLLSPDLSTAWRSGSVAGLVPTSGSDGGAIPGLIPGAVSLVFDLGQPRAVNWVSLHRCNIRVPTRVDYYRTSPFSGGAPVYSGSWTDPVVRAGFSEFTFTDFLFTLGPKESRLRQWTSLYRLDVVLPADKTYYGIRHVAVHFDGSAGINGLVDYLQVAYPVVAQAFRPAVNAVLGWKITPAEGSIVRRTEDLSKRGRKKPRHRTLSFDLGYLERSEAFGKVLDEWVMEHGSLDLVYVWIEPEQRRFYYQQGIFGQLSEQLPGVSMAHLEVPDARGFTIEEAD